ncbi:MAG: FAD-dependent oxidoreductase [Candidatus Woykebacteria bacterium]
MKQVDLAHEVVAGRKADYLIIGGGVAGTTAAEFIRMQDSSGSVVIVMEEPEILYSRVMLPHYLRDQIPFERLYLRKPEQYKEKNIELLTGLRVDKISTQSNNIYLSNGEELQYKKLLIASGGKVTRLPIPGGDLKGVTYLRTVANVKEVKDLMGKAKEGVVIGGGFIGIEYSQSFIKAGIKTTCIIREPYFWSSVVGENSGKLIGKILEKNGVNIISQAQVTEFVGDVALSGVKLDKAQEIPAQIAGVGVGIHMDLDHLKDSGLKINKGVVTNEYLETETQDVWAAGDIAEFKDVIFGKYHQMGNWSNAAAQGKVVGPNMTAGWGSSVTSREQFTTVSAYTISIFDVPFAFMGDPVPDEKTELIERGSVQEGKLGRLHVKEGVLVGASMINLSQDRNAVSELIKKRVKITASKEKLSDTNYNLNSLLPS